MNRGARRLSYCILFGIKSPAFSVFFESHEIRLSRYYRPKKRPDPACLPPLIHTHTHNTHSVYHTQRYRFGRLCWRKANNNSTHITTRVHNVSTVVVVVTGNLVLRARRRRRRRKNRRHARFSLRSGGGVRIRAPGCVVFFYYRFFFFYYYFYAVPFLFHRPPKRTLFVFLGELRTKHTRRGAIRCEKKPILIKKKKKIPENKAHRIHGTRLPRTVPDASRSCIYLMYTL